MSILGSIIHHSIRSIPGSAARARGARLRAELTGVKELQKRLDDFANKALPRRILRPAMLTTAQEFVTAAKHHAPVDEVEGGTLKESIKAEVYESRPEFIGVRIGPSWKILGKSGKPAALIGYWLEYGSYKSGERYHDMKRKIHYTGRLPKEGGFGAMAWMRPAWHSSYRRAEKLIKNLLESKLQFYIASTAAKSARGVMKKWR